MGSWMKWLSRLVLVAMTPVIAGCWTSEFQYPLEAFDALERAASEHGLIAAGAIRVTPYDNAELQRLRQLQEEAIEVLRREFLASAPGPESVSVHKHISKLMIELSLLYSRTEPKTGLQPEADAGALLADIEQSLDKLFTDELADPLTANRIDLARLRLGHLKFLDEQLANLRLLLSTPPEPRYRRMVISVQLTALVRPQRAAGALVYLDLYPARADEWCNEAGSWFRDEVHDQGWEDVVGRLADGTFDPGVLSRLHEPRVSTNERDHIAFAHRYLATHELLPRLVHVEPIDEGEFARTLDLGADLTGVGIGIGRIGGQVSAGLGIGSSDTDALGAKRERILPYSLAFSAGHNRAGWVFLPVGEGVENRPMRPTERRIRMVVDVPADLRKLAVHVHKEFVDETMMPIASASFAQQLEALNRVRYLLSELEKKYPRDPDTLDASTPEALEAIGPHDFKTATNWRLAKSRLRNSLHQAWSEELIATIPQGGGDSYAWVADVPNESAPLAIHGQIVGEVGATDGWLLIHRGLITGIYSSADRLPPLTRRIEHDGFIYPGLIDTHNHPHYNFLPAWSAGRTFANRYEWQDDAAYKKEVAHEYEKLDTNALYLGLKYGEVRAAIGGTTTLQGSFAPDESRVLVRNLAAPYLAASTTARLDTINESTVNDWKVRLADGTLKRLFIHLAEGQKDDEVTKSEFTQLKQMGLLREGVVIIHGVSLGESEFKDMAAAGVHLVWSPKSNDKLYGQTADVLAAIKADVLIALAPDWTITGSDNLLEELKVAANHMSHQLNSESMKLDIPALLYRMATSDAARVAGVDGFLGRLEPGCAADLILAPALREDPHESLLLLTPDKIRAVYVEGAPIYGDMSFLESHGGYQSGAIERIQVGAESKGIVVKGDVRRVPSANEGIDELIKKLKEREITPALWQED